MLITVIGKGGSGKSIIATYIAKKLCENSVTGIISTEMKYAPLTQILDIKIPKEKSLLNGLVKGTDISDYFNFDEKTGLNVLSLDNESDINTYAQVNSILGDSSYSSETQIDTIRKFTSEIKDIFDFLVIDGTDRVSDPLTYGFIEESDIIINVIESSINGIAYNIAHKPLFEILENKSKVINILNKHNESLLNIKEIESSIKTKIDFTLIFDEKTFVNEFSNKNQKTLNTLYMLFNENEERQKKGFVKFFINKKKVKA